MPGVARYVVRRCREGAVGLADGPIRLSLQFSSVTGRAELGVDLRSPGDQLGIGCVRLGDTGNPQGRSRPRGGLLVASVDDQPGRKRDSGNNDECDNGRRPG